MIKPLRKRHLQIWLLLALLLPFGIISAWLVVPKPVTDHLLQPSSTDALPMIWKTIEKNDFTISLRSSKDSFTLQLECTNKSALTAPSAIIYQIGSEDSNIEGSGIIGRIGERGTYHFQVKRDPANHEFHFVIYDIIHHQIIDRINF